MPDTVSFFSSSPSSRSNLHRPDRFAPPYSAGFLVPSFPLLPAICSSHSAVLRSVCALDGFPRCQGMAEDAKGSVVTAGGPRGGDPVASSDPSGKREGLLSRLWHGLFRGRGEDYEKKLQYLSREEASVQARMKRRARRGRNTARNIIVFSVVLEVVAVTYAIIATRSPELSWQMRAVHVLPMFVLPALASAIYSVLFSLTRMFDLRDQKTLERLRDERQAKIDELKERTNYYTTQQLIQRYDLDPAAKAAAATVLASKLGADSGLNVYVGDDAKLDRPHGKSSNVELVQSDGLRSRKQPHTHHQSTGHEMLHHFVRETSPDVSADDQEVSAETHGASEHYKSSGTGDGGWIARIAAMLVGEDPSQCYALICGNCHMHNGLARKEDFPYITYYCPHCRALNGSRQAEEQDSGFISGQIASSEPSNVGIIAPDVSKGSSITEVEVSCKLATSEEEPIENSKVEQPGVPGN